MAGRPRSTDADTALRTAVATSLIERGYGATTVDAVARAAGVPKSTLYRRWPSKSEMIFETIVHARVLDAPPDTDALDGDLREIAAAIVAALASPAARRAVPGLLDEAFGVGRSRFRDTVVAGEQAFVRAALDRAAARSELHGDVAALATTIYAQLLGTVLVRTAVLDETLPNDMPDRLARAALATIHAEESAPCSTT